MRSAGACVAARAWSLSLWQQARLSACRSVSACVNAMKYRLSADGCRAWETSQPSQGTPCASYTRTRVGSKADTRSDMSASSGEQRAHARS
eukprot:5311393-Pleurochrysis_carterae.AAC.4